jgi:hypothetical protein
MSVAVQSLSRGVVCRAPLHSGITAPVTASGRTLAIIFRVAAATTACRLPTAGRQHPRRSRTSLAVEDP